MSNSKMREEFETACRKHAEDAGFGEYDYGFERSSEDSGCYADSHTQAAWWAWQASREALVIELPEPYAVIGDYAACGGGKAVWDIEYAAKITDRMCEKTAVYDKTGLEAAGLKVSK